MRDYQEIQHQIDQLTNTTQDERHNKQAREQQACERRLFQMKQKQEKKAKREAAQAIKIKDWEGKVK